MDRGSGESEVTDVKKLGFVGTLKQLPNRAVSLIFNLISRWGLMLALNVYAVRKGWLVEQNALIAWLVFNILFLFKSDGMEFIKDLVKSIKG